MNALIVGASGGLGSALAVALAKDARFDTVVGTVRRPKSAADIALDLTDEDSIAAAARAVAGRVDALDRVIVASGLLHDGDGVQPEKKLEELNGRSLARYFQVNAIGPVLVARHFLPLMRKEGDPVFAAISARVGSIGDNRLGGWYGYRASKAALNMLLRTVSREARRRYPRVTVVALHPGTVDTPLSRPFQANVPAKQLFTPGQSARMLLEVMDGLEPEQSGSFVAYDGTPIEW